MKPFMRVIAPLLRLQIALPLPELLLKVKAPTLSTASTKMKRKLGSATSPSKPKKVRAEVPDYCDVEVRKDARGSVVWPAPEEAMDKARDFLREW